ncbi:unnamed protein product [Ilex paraguariensis]|uniref:Ubiquitin-like domain-containing protein n=1 Tax=Ilex paraguariensis TaxID=185542 RepID=A0ABC8TUF6_9AQUA
MLGMKPKTTGMPSPAKRSTAGRRGGGGSEAAGWELRPGGMLVQRRNSDSNQSSIPVPTIKIRVKYGSFYQEIHISSQASFGELKKMLAGTTGLHPQDQKLIYKDKERDSKAFLDVAGVKDGSKMELVEDVMSRDRRCLESRKNAKMDQASKEIKEIGLEVDKLAKQVKIVQKNIEILDMLKIRNSILGSNGSKTPLQQHQKISTGQVPILVQNQKEKRNLTGHMPGPVVVTTKWETF